MSRRLLRTVSVCIRIVQGAIALGTTLACGADDEVVSFNHDIRPIMSDTCFQCHGPDANKREGDLRLDRLESATADRGGYAALVPGYADESEMIWLIFSDDPSEQMPPEEHARQLSDKEKELFRKWVEQGAPYEEHWAYVAPKMQALPDAKGSTWGRNGIDAFVLAKLEHENLRPSREAEKATLIRRVTLDLTGLPPTLEEIEDFLKDRSPDAYEVAIDRLLASPRYGERLVWEWLDAARYADSNGYQKDNNRGMWPWRDWAV